MTPKPEYTSSICVIDAGARYGIHPTWRGLACPLSYQMFEPDEGEARRLSNLYSEDANIVSVHQMALGAIAGKVMINVLQHHGQSSMLQPNLESVWFSRVRPKEAEIVETYEAEVTTIDDFCRDNRIVPDFIKSDTEGAEFDIVCGARDMLGTSVLGLRCEVQFRDVFRDGHFFGEVDDALRRAGFMLLNLDYAGAGFAMNKFHLGSRYGVLEASDATWIKSFESIEKDPIINEDEKVARCLKLAIFCFKNNAPDVAMQFLIDMEQRYRSKPPEGDLAGVWRAASILVQKHFKLLQEHAAFSEMELDDVYSMIFNDLRKKMHNHYEDPELGP